jgi:pyridoxamine 5'-phosphate oxidase
MVLLKDFTTEGFTFFTNYSSRKGQELESNPQAALLFYWDRMSRQVRIEGRVKRIEREKSVEYFSMRPFGSRVSAYISDQSKVIPSRQHLIDLQCETMEKFNSDQHVPAPDNWGGYVLVPDEIEFWQGNDIRLHDRLRFRRLRDVESVVESGSDLVVVGENGWVIERLAP